MAKCEMTEDEAGYIIQYLVNLEMSLSTVERKTYDYRVHITEAREAYMKQKKEEG